MTEKQWAESQHGRTYAAICEVENALDDLAKMPREVLQQYQAEIAAAALSFGCMINALRKDAS